jgi:hypothetical protein
VCSFLAVDLALRAEPLPAGYCVDTEVVALEETFADLHIPEAHSRRTWTH